MGIDHQHSDGLDGLDRVGRGGVVSSVHQRVGGEVPVAMIVGLQRNHMKPSMCYLLSFYLNNTTICLGGTTPATSTSRNTST